MAEIPLTMPKMSMTMEEGTLVEWSVAEGDVIAKGDVVAVVMTDKVDMEVESPAAGSVARLIAAEGDVVPVGDSIAMVASEEEDLLGDLFSGDGGGGAADGGTAERGAPQGVPEADDAAQVDAREAAQPGAPGEDPPAPQAGVTSEPQAAPAERASGGAATEQPTGRSELPPAVPLARKIAKDHGLDLRTITPTGPHGTVRVKDVKEALKTAERGAGEAAAAAPASSAATPAAGISAPAGAAPAPVAEAAPDELLGDARARRTRQLTAAAMEPTTVVPQFTAYRTMDLSVAARARAAVLSGISWTTLIVRAYAILLREQEQLNGFWAGNGVKRNNHVGVVLAVDTPGGLMVPVLTDPDQIPLRELDGEVRSIAADAKEGKIDPSLLGGGTGTVSNLGSLGVDRFNALITPPQATALSVGSVGYQPVFSADATLEARMSCELGLSIDHRAADGADAARALHRLQDLLGDPLRLAV